MRSVLSPTCQDSRGNFSKYKDFELFYMGIDHFEPKKCLDDETVGRKMNIDGFVLEKIVIVSCK